MSVNTPVAFVTALSILLKKEYDDVKNYNIEKHI